MILEIKGSWWQQEQEKQESISDHTIDILLRDTPLLMAYSIAFESLSKIILIVAFFKSKLLAALVRYPFKQLRGDATAVASLCC